MLEEGLDNQLARHARLAEGTRKAVKAWGLELLCKDERWNSNSLTVIKVPDGVDSNIVVNKAYTRYNLSIGIGLSQVNGKVFRIGHLGDMNEVSLLGTKKWMEWRWIAWPVDSTDLFHGCGRCAGWCGDGTSACWGQDHTRFWGWSSSAVLSRDVESHRWARAVEDGMQCT
eukprot:scaffold5608_cov386-Prasinococcus_capsulatus_cf.AAC.2